jgi:hypothetical protein
MDRKERDSLWQLVIQLYVAGPARQLTVDGNSKRARFRGVSIFSCQKNCSCTRTSHKRGIRNEAADSCARITHQS